MNDETPYCIVLTTMPDEAQGDTLATRIVEAGLGACVQIQPVRSVYRWQGQLCRAPECLLLIKTRRARFEALAQFIRAHHPYETPEIVQIPITAGSSDYLRWVDAGTQG